MGVNRAHWLTRDLIVTAQTQPQHNFNLTLHTHHHPTPPHYQTQLPSQGASDQPLMLLKQQEQQQPNKTTSKQLAVTSS